METNMSNPQEWTPKHVELLLGSVVSTGTARISDAHNAALAAERGKREQAEAMTLDAHTKADLWRKQIEPLVEALTDAIRELHEGYPNTAIGIMANALAKAKERK
jgi:phage gp29-like protein